jgi:predicted TIM-barrel fold metal-dependent hydrolase
LYSPVYEPLWQACEDADLPVNHHGGSAVPPMGDQPVDNVMFLLEVAWWAHRALWHLIFGGVLERHPALHLVFTEQETSWIPETLGTLDYFFSRMGASSGSQGQEWGAEVVGKLSLRPSEYWARQCHVGSTFMRRAEAALRHDVGIDKIMWASDYPHKESSFPFSRAALRRTFAGIDAGEVQQMLGGNAAELYRFDMRRLAEVAARVGPSHEEIDQALPADEIPPEAARCPAFD